MRYKRRENVNIWRPFTWPSEVFLHFL